MTVGAVIQARMGSTRLRGKVLADLAGRPVLDRIVERLRAAHTVDVVIIATTTSPLDDAIAGYAESQGVDYFRGSEDDVLGRYQAVASEFGLAATIRITADCPLTDPALVDEVVERWTESLGGCDFVANTLVRRYPRGLDVSLVSASALARAAAEATDPADRTHVTTYIRNPENDFRLCSVEGPLNLGHWRWTLDEPDDLTFLRSIYERLTPVADYDWRRVHALLIENPDLADLNRAVRQKVPHEL